MWKYYDRSDFEETEGMDDEAYVWSDMAADDFSEAYLDEGSTDNDLDNTVVFYDDFDWMAGFHAWL